MLAVPEEKATQLRGYMACVVVVMCPYSRETIKTKFKSIRLKYCAERCAALALKPKAVLLVNIGVSFSCSHNINLFIYQVQVLLPMKKKTKTYFS